MSYEICANDLRNEVSSQLIIQSRSLLEDINHNTKLSAEQRQQFANQVACTAAAVASFSGVLKNDGEFVDQTILAEYQEQVHECSVILNAIKFAIDNLTGYWQQQPETSSIEVDS